MPVFYIACKPKAQSYRHLFATADHVEPGLPKNVLQSTATIIAKPCTPAMSETLNIPSNASKETVYDSLITQLSALIAAETDRTAALANVTAALHDALGFFWTGFYLIKNDRLTLNVFQGPIACSRIAYGRGVCGTAWAEKRTIKVDDVDEFPGHIACSSLSRSEIVVPLVKNGKVLGVLDIDSDKPTMFDDTDREKLEKLCEIIVCTCF